MSLSGRSVVFSGVGDTICVRVVYFNSLIVDLKKLSLGMDRLLLDIVEYFGISYP